MRAPAFGRQGFGRGPGSEFPAPPLSCALDLDPVLDTSMLNCGGPAARTATVQGSRAPAAPLLPSRTQQSSPDKSPPEGALESKPSGQDRPGFRRGCPRQATSGAARDGRYRSLVLRQGQGSLCSLLGSHLTATHNLARQVLAVGGLREAGMWSSHGYYGHGFVPRGASMAGPGVPG